MLEILEIAAKTKKQNKKNKTKNRKVETFWQYRIFQPKFVWFFG
jgi:hypothetical protein